MRIKLKKLGYVNKEERLASTAHRKMDAVNLMGVWTNFPEQVTGPAPTPTGRGPFGAGWWLMMAAAKQRGKLIKQAKKKKDKSVLDDLILRLEQEHLTNVVLFLAEA